MTTGTSRTDAVQSPTGYRVLCRALERELAEAKALAEHNITTKAEIDRVWGEQTRELRAELADQAARFHAEIVQRQEVEKVNHELNLKGLDRLRATVALRDDSIKTLAETEMQLRAELVEAKAAQSRAEIFLDSAHEEIRQLRAEVNTLREIAHEENCPHQYYTEGGIIYGVHGTSSITYVEELRKEREQLRARVETLQAAVRGADGLLHNYLVALSEPGQPLLHHGNSFEYIRQLRAQLKELQTLNP